MSEEANQQALLDKAMELSATLEDEDEESGEDLDESSEESSETPNPDTESPEKVEGEDDKDTEEKTPEVDLSFRDTPTNVKQFVANLEGMSQEKRLEKIKSLDPKRSAAELSAAKEMFPDLFDESKKPDDESGSIRISKDEWESVKAKLAILDDTEKAKEALAVLKELNTRQPMLESELSDRMLKDKFGDRYEDVKADPKFGDAMKKLGKLDLVDRLEQSVMHSQVARDILIEKQAVVLERQKAAAKRKPGVQTDTKPKKEQTGFLTAEDVLARFGDKW